MVWDSEAEPDFEPPDGETEAAIAAIWSELLGRERIGRHDDFFELGGHSLLAMQMASRLAQTFGLQLSAADLFATPTVAALAEAVLEAMLAHFSDDDVRQVNRDVGPA